MATWESNTEREKTSVPRYQPRDHVRSLYQLRQYIIAKHPLGSQICIEGEITIETIDAELQWTSAREQATQDLALKRSRSYSLTRSAALSDLFAEASADESSAETSGPDNTDTDVPVREATRSTAFHQAHGEEDDARSHSGGARARPPEDETKHERREAEHKTATREEEGTESVPASRRSSRLRKKGTGAPESRPAQGRGGGAASAPPTNPDQRADTTGEDGEQDQRRAATAAAGEGEGAPQPSLDPEGGDDDEEGTDDGESSDTVPMSASQNRLIARLQRQLAREKRLRRKRISRKRRQSEKGGCKAIVNRAKAIGTLLRQTIDPLLWETLPRAIRTEAYHQANNQVWIVISTSLGYHNSHLIGQLREGDGKGAWARLNHLHAEETNGAQAHYLQELMSCTYAHANGSGDVGGVRRFADALQRINKLYKLSAGHFVQPEILMSRLLTLPPCYDTVVESIEEQNARRASQDGRLLDFDEVLARVVQFENRVQRRRRQSSQTKRMPDYYPKKGRGRGYRKGRRRGGAPREARAFLAAGTKGNGRNARGQIICYRCGKPGHIARECEEDVSGVDNTTRGQQTTQKHTASRADQRQRGGKRFGRRRKKPSVGFLAVEEESCQARVALGKSRAGRSSGEVIIDSGASGHFCVTGTELNNARATRRVISSAGDQTLVGRAVGDWGSLVDTVAVEGLRTGLASVGRLADHYQAHLIFTPEKVYAVPSEGIPEEYARMLEEHRVIGRRGNTGLYMGNAQNMAKVMTAENGFTEPRRPAVGAHAMTSLERCAQEGLQGEMFAMSALQRTSRVRRSRIPRSVRGPTRYRGTRPKGDRSGRREAWGMEQDHPPKIGVGGCHAHDALPANLEITRVPGTSSARFIDLGCGIGGFTRAAMLAGWTPVASVDFCKAAEGVFAWNFAHPFERVNLVKRGEREALIRKYRDIDVVLFSPPCQPYSVAGKQRSGDTRTQVVGAGIDVILRWRPKLVVIECVANFITCDSNPTYRETVAPRLTKAGYILYVAHLDAAKCGIPVRRRRVFIVATLYPRRGELERHMEALFERRDAVLADWLPHLEHVYHAPCHGAPAVFNAKTQPHPVIRTGSLCLKDKKRYRARRGDSAPAEDAVELSLGQTLSLAGMGKGFHWPKPGWHCRERCCSGYGRYSDFLGRCLGNVVVPAQALEVLQRCEVERNLNRQKSKAAVGVSVRTTQPSPDGGTSGNSRTGAMEANALYAAVADGARVNSTDRGVIMTQAGRPRTNTTKLMNAHKRMGHCSKNALKRILAEGSMPELRGVTTKEIDDMPPCDTCAQSKLTKQPHAHGLKNRRRAKGINFVIHTDTMHRTVPSMRRKDIYVQVFVDEHTRYVWVETFGSKTYKAFSEMLERAEARMQAQHRESAEYAASGSTGRGRPVLRYFSDQAAEMVGGKQRARLAKILTSLTVISPSAKLSNGIAERANRTLLDIARSLLIGADLPIAFWAEAFEMAADIYNRTGRAANKGKSPYELYFGTPPQDMHRIKVFGCKCFVHEDKDRRKQRSKLNATARPCVYMGMSRDDNRSHRVFDPRTDKFYTGTSIVFREDEPGGYLVANSRKVRARMKELVWRKWQSRGNEKTGREAPSEQSDPEPEELGDLQEEESEEDNNGSDEDDTWNQVYRARNNDTFEEISEAFDIPVAELLSHNMGIPGCDVATGEIHPKAKLRRGTGIWLPDNAVRRVTERENLYPSIPEEDPPSGEAKEPEVGQPEPEAEGDELSDETNAEPSAVSWNKRLRSRSKKAPDAVGLVFHSDVADHCIGVVMEHARTAAELMAKADNEAAAAERVPHIVKKAENRYHMAYHAVVRDLSQTLARDVPVPKSYRDALSGEFGEVWNSAVMRELHNLASHDVWEWCELPKGRNHTIDATWAWRVKSTSQGFVDKVKARLCARGFREIYGLDYVETHAPVTTLTSWRACLAEAANKDWGVHIWDVASAYLLSEIPESTPIYLRPFEGLEIPTDIPHTRPLVLKLKRCLYGLKSSGRRWNQTIDLKLKEKGFRQSANDPCLYVKETKEGIIRLNLHVDDCCATFSNADMYSRFFADLQKEYKLSESTDNNMFLGMLIERMADGGIQIHQKHFLEEVLTKFQATQWKPVKTPARKEIKLSKEHAPQSEEDKRKMARVPYRQIVGSLMYLANCTRPDISQALGACARFCANPGEMHWNALKWILRYLNGTRDLCIQYGRSIPDVPSGALHGYVDGSWGDDPDDRRSTTGYCFMSHGGPIVWRSQKQRSVALSTCESEYMAASEAAKEAVWLLRLYKDDLGYQDLSIPTYGDLSEKEFEGSKPLVIFEDNTGCIALSRNPVQHKRSKHISIRYHWMREKIQSGELKLSKIDTSLNIADVFTKPTSGKTFAFLVGKLVHPRGKQRADATINLAEPETKAEGEVAPTWCHACGKVGHIEPECPRYLRPDEVAEKHAEEENVKSKHSESLLVARPDGQHKGSNDMAESSRESTQGDFILAARAFGLRRAMAVQHAVRELEASLLTRQRQLRKALGRWREAHGQDYTGEPEQRHRYIEALKSSITEHEVRIAIGRMTLRDGADRKAIIRHRIQKAIEEKLDGLMLRTAHLAVGQIGPCMCVDVYFDITDAMHINVEFGPADETKQSAARQQTTTSMQEGQGSNPLCRGDSKLASARRASRGVAGADS